MLYIYYIVLAVDPFLRPCYGVGFHETALNMHECYCYSDVAIHLNSEPPVEDTHETKERDFIELFRNGKLDGFLGDLFS